MKLKEHLQHVESLDNTRIKRRYQKFIIKEDHPCVMAQTLFEQNQVDFVFNDNMGTVATTLILYKRIKAYVDNYDFNSNEFNSLIAVFSKDKFSSELDFEKALWNQLQALHSIDNQLWDKQVSKDPSSSQFSFSIAGKAFYIVGMHPESSRMARSAPYPTIVFNLHWQFEKLREMGAYATVKKRIRKRDKALQGSINPVLKDFGKDSEAKQYSGRKVSERWKCPFINEHQ